MSEPPLDPPAGSFVLPSQFGLARVFWQIFFYSDIILFSLLLLTDLKRMKPGCFFLPFLRSWFGRYL